MRREAWSQAVDFEMSALETAITSRPLTIYVDDIEQQNLSRLLQFTLRHCFYAQSVRMTCAVP